jgi:alpha-D-ribose 1-methylphosphonate 5-phosphate C-P lyase
MRSIYNYAFLDEGSKREIRRAILKAIAIPGYQVPFASRELPIARGWGTGGLQLTLALIGESDTLKVIDQGADDSVNALSIKRLVESTTGVPITEDTRSATLIQSRHRVPEVKLREGQILVLQVPLPEPLRMVEPSEYKTKRLHAEKDYSGVYLVLFEEIQRKGVVAMGSDHPVEVEGRYVMAPSPIPRFDNPKLDMNSALILLGAGREKKIYAIPPYTKVKSLDFEDFPFEVEDFAGARCELCGAGDTYLDEIVGSGGGARRWRCNDTSSCAARGAASGDARSAVGGTKVEAP